MADFDALFGAPPPAPPPLGAASKHFKAPVDPEPAGNDWLGAVGLRRPNFPPIDYAAELNPEQLAAATAPDGPALVLAGAGSGKTRTLTYRVAYLLEQGVRPWDILLVTFTNKAAREMLGRVEDLTNTPRSQFWGGTFHSLGQRILRRHGGVLGIDPGFTILDQGDSEALLSETIRALDPGFTKNKDHPKPKVIYEMFSYSRNTGQLLVDVVESRYPWLKELADQLLRFTQAYTDRKRKAQLCDYDDLLELWLRLLTQGDCAHVRDHLQTRFRYVLVDEYQDTNTVQAGIVNRMAAQHRNLMVVGDNWQCIYTWRGAAFENMAEFAERFPERKIYKVETNYRSTPAILNLANDLMGHHPPIDGYPLNLKAARPERDLPLIVPQLDTRQQAWWILRKIEHLLDEGRALRDIAILYRAHFQALDLQMEFSRAGVPYTITSGVRFFEQAHIRDLVAQLRFLSNPYDQPAFVRVIGLLPKVGEITAVRLHELLQRTSDRYGTTHVAAMLHPDVLRKVPSAAVDSWRSLAETLAQVEAAMGGPTVRPRPPAGGNAEPAGNRDGDPTDLDGDSAGPGSSPVSATAAARKRAKKSSAKRTRRQGSDAAARNSSVTAPVPSLPAPTGDLFGPEDFLATTDPARQDSPANQGASPPSSADGADASVSTENAAATPAGSANPGTSASPEEIVTLTIDGWYGDYLRNLYDNWQSRRDDLDSLKGFASRYDSMTEMLAQLVLLNSETSDRRIDPEEDTVKLSTVHQAKGLEFPVVFILGLSDNLFPLKRAIESGDLDEERRLLYVAVTRAQDELYLMYPRMTTSGGPPQMLQPSRFLHDLPETRYHIAKS